MPDPVNIASICKRVRNANQFTETEKEHIIARLLAPAAEAALTYMFTKLEKPANDPKGR